MNRVVIFIGSIFGMLFIAGLGVRGIHAANTAVVQATITITVCGNGVKETGEECDGGDLSGGTCSSRGFSGGTLQCSPACEYNISACTSGSSSGGGSAPGAVVFIPPPTAILFTGSAPPKSEVVLEEDGEIVGRTTADEDAHFQIRVEGITEGSRNFSLNGTPLPNPVQITSGTTTTVRGLTIEPPASVPSRNPLQFLGLIFQGIGNAFHALMDSLQESAGYLARALKGLLGTQ